VEEILTPSEVAVLFKMHVNTVYKLAEQGVIPGSRLGHNWRFNKTEILKVLSKKKRKPSRLGNSRRHNKRNSHGGVGEGADLT